VVGDRSHGDASRRDSESPRWEGRRRTDSVRSWGVCSDRLNPSTRTREAKKSADGRGIRGVTRLGAASSPWEREAWEYPGLPRLQPEIGKVPDYLVEHYGTKEVEK